MEALWIWRQFPRQIASDLSRFHQRRIADWHKGRRDEHGDLVLSSYELLELLEFMPDDGAFKTDAERGGRWPTWKQMMAESVNEAYRFRSSYHVVNGGAEAGFDTSELVFVDPVIRAHRERLAAIDAEEQQNVTSQFEAEIGFS